MSNGLWKVVPAMLVVVRVLGILVLLAAAAGGAGAQEGEGEATITPGVSPVHSTGTWTLRYVVGPSGIATGGGLRAGFSSFPTTIFDTPQTENPAGPNYVTAAASRPGVRLSLAVGTELRGGWMRLEVAAVTVTEGKLAPGDTVTLVYGDRSGGGPGGRVRRGNELAQVEIPTFVDATGKGKFERIAGQPKLDLVGTSPVLLQVFAPSLARSGREFEVSVVAKDGMNNVGMDFGGAVRLECPAEAGFAPLTVHFPEKGPAAKRVRVRLEGEGVRTLRAALPTAPASLRRIPAAAFLESSEPADAGGFRPRLEAVELNTVEARPGSSLRAVTHWRNVGTRPGEESYRISFHLLKRGEQRAVRNWDYDPEVPTTQWGPGREVAAARVCALPPALPEGDYVIRAGLYRLIEPGKWQTLAMHLVCPFRVSNAAVLTRVIEAGESNPVLLSRGEPDLGLYWGDTHVHTEHSGDGSGSVHAMYDYARDVARLDFAAASDHVDANYPKSRWREIQVAAAEHNTPNDFVSILGYEWSNQLHGDKNVYFLDDYQEILVPRSGQAEDFYRMLRGKQLFAVPHHPAYPVGLRGMDWTRVDTEIIRLVEMCSTHGTAEYLGNPDAYGRNKPMGPSLPGGFAQDALRRGLRVGLIASSDDHTAHAGRIGFLAAVYAPGLTRRHLFDAFRARHCYGTSGARILVDFRVNDRLLGSEIESASPPVIRARVVGTGDLERVEVIKSGRVVYAKEGDGREAQFTYSDLEFTEPSAWYYLRVTQRDGQRAWTSPVWVRSLKPFPDPAVEEVAPARREVRAGAPTGMRVVVRNRGKAPAPAGRVLLTAGGPAWSLAESETQPSGGGIGGLMARRGFQLWRYRVDERTLNVFLRWGGGAKGARCTGEVRLHGVEGHLFTPFHCEEEDRLEDAGGGRITWETQAEAGTGDGMNLQVRLRPGEDAWLDLDVRHDGERHPEEVFTQLGKTTALPLRVDLARRNPEARETSVEVPALRPGEKRALQVDLAFPKAGKTALTAAIVPEDSLAQGDSGNDTRSVEVNVR